LYEYIDLEVVGEEGRVFGCKKEEGRGVGEGRGRGRG
jgi:hypothetical protein